MDTMKKLYQIKAQKYASLPYCENMAKEYENAASLIENCKDEEAAFEAFEKNGVPQKLMRARELDKLSALKASAEKNKSARAFEQYDKLYKECLNAKDETVGTVETKYKEIQLAHSLRHYHFNNIFVSYVNSVGEDIDFYITDSVNASLAELKNAGADFFDMAREPEYRSLVPLNDEQYEEFISFVKNIDVPTEDKTQAQTTLFAQTWKIIKDMKDEIKIPLDAQTEKSCFIAAAPFDENGKYQFVEIKAETK